MVDKPDNILKINRTLPFGVPKIVSESTVAAYYEDFIIAVVATTVTLPKPEALRVGQVISVSNISDGIVTVNGGYAKIGTSQTLDVTKNTITQFTSIKSDKWVTTFSSSGATDNDAIHDNVSAEVSLITLKSSPVYKDLLLLEDSADGYSKKRVRISDLPGFEDIKFPSTGMVTPGAGTDPSRDTATGFLQFSPNATNMVVGVAQMPPNWIAGAIKPHIHHYSTTNPNGTGDVVWELQYRWYNNDETIPSAYTTLEETFILSDHSGGLQVADLNYFDEIDGYGKDESSMFEWKLSRLGGDEYDTYANYSVLTEFDIHVLS